MEPHPDSTDGSHSAAGSREAEPVLRKPSQRSHNGNIPYLPQTKLCHLCPAKFTRQTHLNRHLKTHTGERLHHCDKCDAKFTRSDLLNRHKGICAYSESPGIRKRKQACQHCANAKVKCDGGRPCARCRAKGRECIMKNKTESISASAGPEEVTLPAPESVPYIPATVGPASGHVARDESSFEFSSLTAFDDLLPFASMMEGSHDATASTDLGAASGSSLALLEPSASSELALVPSSLGKSHLEELFSDDTYDSLLFGIFDSNFHKPPELPGQYFQYDPMNVLEDRFSSALLSDGNLPDYSLGLELSRHSIKSTAPRSAHQEIPYCPRLAPGSYSRDILLEWLPESTASASGSTSSEPEFSDADLQLFLTTFFKTFAIHVPIVHAATIDIDHDIPVLFTAIRACGAMYVPTPSAKRYIDHVLKTVRDELVAKFSAESNNFEVVTQLLQAYVMVQVMGLAHTYPEQRARTSVYHGIVAMMLRMNGFHDKISQWKPGDIDFSDPLSVHAEWRRWVKQQTAVRAAWVCLAQDNTHCMNFNVLPTAAPHFCRVPLPCEEELWNACSGEEWAALLQQPSPYGTVEERLVGTRMTAVYECLAEGNTRFAPHTVILNPLAQTLYLLCLLTGLHEHYLRDRMPDPDAGGDAALWTRTRLKPNTVHMQRAFSLQLQLHYWFTSWQRSPAPNPAPGGQLPFFLNPLPFYWLAQLCLLAYQEGLPPFDADGTYITSRTAKFELLKRWERHIREFLASGEERPATEFWESVMMSRLDALQAETGWTPRGDFDHLLGFYVSYTR